VSSTPVTKLQPYHLKIIAYIRTKGFITDRIYATLVDRAKATRALDFQKLLEQGIIDRKEKGRATYYVLKERT